ncbi:PC3-like endoprotease variant B [Hydractinia symbiolongicarpus]|uniref:PC3-like endoprotease variant B n=1 Tax=Hydractinia symbiolongicarpus TaxID=13093 RepID=UPI00254B8289|nr:PC3-like endoprotease variant B [Hydractinia symbiolongicarpus]
MRQSKVKLIYIVLVVTSIQGVFTSPAHRKNAKTVKDGTIRVSHEDRDNRYSKKINFNARQLSKRDKEYLAKLEDSLQSKEGKILFTNSWAVQLDPAEVAQADRIAEKHGFENLGQIGNLEGFFHFKHKKAKRISKRSLHGHSRKLVEEKKVLWAEQQHLLDRRRKDGMPSDPKFLEQWYLNNRGQSTGPPGVDLNVLPVWKQGITGRGVVVSVLDDGVDHNHPDLRDNYDQKASYDFNDMDSDPKPRDSDPDNCHGTRCAGEIAAAANNSICGVGVAYDANIGGVRMLDGQATDILEGSSLSFQSNYIDIYSNCWGPKDDGKTFGKPGRLAQEALMRGALEGRNARGNIYVWATGNGGLTDDDCNCDGYTTSIYTISIGCISDHGLSAYYTELCSSTLAVTFNGGSHREKEENKMITTDLHNKCTDEFKGTSSSAPLAAGVIALTLQANPNLTWRDVQHLIVNTAQVTSPVDEGWMDNGGGFHFNHKFGFGRLDAAKMVEAAKNWKTVPKQRICSGPSSNSVQEIPAGGTLSITIDTISCEGSEKEITKLEHVTLTISFQHRRRGDVSIDLFSPMGTRNEMLSTRRYDDSDKGLHDWTFMTVHNWGENPKGVWTLNVTDNILSLTSKGFNLNGYLQHDTSKQEPDVEDLEEEVIDDEKKMKDLEERKKKKNKQKDTTGGNSALDVPYPDGVRKRSKIHTYQIKTDDLDEDKNLLDTDEQINEMLHDSEKKTVVTGSNDGELSIESTEGYGNNNGDISAVEGERIFDSAENIFGKSAVSEGQDIDQNNQVYGYDRNFEEIKKNRDKSATKRTGLSYQDPRVQVQEETGSQRVQVSNGFQEPFLPALSSNGRVSSGQLLEWSLVFYGTGPEEEDN